MYDESHLYLSLHKLERHPRRLMKLRTSEPNLLVHILFIQCKRLLEHPTKLLQLLLERLLVGPRQRRVQKLPRDTLKRSRYREVEDAKVLKLSLGELARVDSVDDAARVLERAAFAIAIFATSPASVDEPAIDLVLGHTFSQHLGVATRL